MEEIVLVKKYSAGDLSPINTKEVLRYAGYSGEPDEETKKLLKDVMSIGKFSYRVAYFRTEGFPFEHQSSDLGRLLEGAHSTYLVGATLGVELDRLIAKYQKTSPAKALMLDALGTERIEALLDKFCLDITGNEISRGNQITKRYSPGYGDFAIEKQEEMFKLLDLSKRIGVSLNDSLLMSPSKSVTCVMGVKKASARKPLETQCLYKCQDCKKANCAFRGR